jgi:hypothetical protein
MSESQQNKNGCAWLFSFGIITFGGTMLIIAFSDLPLIVSLFISGFMGVSITIKLLGKSNAATIIRNIIFVFLLVISARWVLLSLLNFIKTTQRDVSEMEVEEGVGTSYILEENDTITIYSSHRLWKDNYGNNFDGDLAVREKDFLRLYNHINLFKPSNQANFWGNLYDYIERTDTPSLDLVIRTFEKIHATRQFNQMEFAEMIISCVQDIPYSFVFQEECLSPDSYEDAIREFLEYCPDCCIGNKTYGIQNPVSFIQNLKGDCDTRTVLVYSILKYFNYDVAILNSDFYRHSIIGINLPSSGTFKMYRGKKYVVWETTAKYYTAGQLPANFNDITHWYVVLTSK